MLHLASPRRLATTAQVHPKFLRYMHASTSFTQVPTLRRLPFYAVIAGLGYVVATYNISGPTIAQDSHLSSDKLALLDAYGGRESLEELEMATRVYSSQVDNRA